MGSERRDVRLPALLVLGFIAAVVLRILVGRPDVSGSATGGLVFAGALLLLSIMGGARPKVSVRAVLAGIGTGALLCFPAVLARLALSDAHRPGGSYLRWAAVVAVVATCEELFLRGTLYDAVSRWRGAHAAIAVSAVLFALLHLPLYGPAALPLDLGIGLILGWLRERTGSAAAPAVAHVVADLAAWWLR
jgi:membrane protease YdiL (CAAX protease family)